MCDTHRYIYDIIAADGLEVARFRGCKVGWQLTLNMSLGKNDR
jgi:hypothetical protein